MMSKTVENEVTNGSPSIDLSYNVKGLKHSFKNSILFQLPNYYIDLSRRSRTKSNVNNEHTLGVKRSLSSLMPENSEM